MTSTHEFHQAIMTPQDREIERRVGLARELISTLERGLFTRLPHRGLEAQAYRTREVMRIPRGSLTTLYPPSNGPIFTDTDGNRWNLTASIDGFTLQQHLPRPAIDGESETTVNDEEFLSAQTRSSYPAGVIHESWTSHEEGTGAETTKKATDVQRTENEATTVSTGKEFIGRFIAALKAVPADDEI